MTRPEDRAARVPSASGDAAPLSLALSPEGRGNSGDAAPLSLALSPEGRGKWAVAAAIVAGAIAALAAAQALLAPPAALDRARRGAAAEGPGGEQVVALELAGGAYAPNVVRVRAGAPLRLRVTVRDADTCATRLLVPDLGVDLALVPGGTSEALVAAPAPGGHVFTCAAKMVKGTIVVE